MKITLNFNLYSLLVFAGVIALSSGCSILKSNLDTADFTKFRKNNQAQLDSLFMAAGTSAAIGMADTAELITQRLIAGLKGSMDTLDPDFQKLKLKIQERSSENRSRASVTGRFEGSGD